MGRERPLGGRGAAVDRGEGRGLSERARIAVIGCGAWGRNHVRTLASLGLLYAVADESGERSFELAAEHDVLPLAPAQVLEDERIDGVVLALPAQLHVPMAIDALRAGKHVLSEKPLALSSAEGERAVTAARETGRHLMVGHVLRHHPVFRRLMALVAEGALGRLSYAQSHRLGMGRFHASFDAAWDLAPHDLSMVLALAGEAPTVARGRGATLLPGPQDALLDNALIHMRFASGMSGHVMVSRHSPYRERRLTVVGERAMAVWDDLLPQERKLAIHRHTVTPNARGGHDFELSDPDYVPVEDAMPLTAELLNFAAAIEGREPVLTPGEEGVAVVRVLEQALLEARA